jgi:bacterioferritin
MNEKPFLTAVKTLRDRARRHMRQGAVTPGYKGDRETILKILNEALATELVCVLRYKRHFFTAKGIHAKTVAAEFAEHAAEEMAHADLLAERIVQLGGEPDYSPASLALRSHSEYVEGENLAEMVDEDLVAERIAIESYGEMIRYIGTNDSTTRRVLETILQKEEHADDLASIMQGTSLKTPDQQPA